MAQAGGAHTRTGQPGSAGPGPERQARLRGGLGHPPGLGLPGAQATPELSKWAGGASRLL